MEVTLFDPPLARKDDPLGSHEAAKKLIKSGRRKSQKQRVLEALRRNPGCTSAELAVYSGLDRIMCARRLPDLAYDGKVIQGNEKFCTVSQIHCVTWTPVKENSNRA